MRTALTLRGIGEVVPQPPNVSLPVESIFYMTIAPPPAVGPSRGERGIAPSQGGGKQLVLDHMAVSRWWYTP